MSVCFLPPVSAPSSLFVVAAGRLHGARLLAEVPGLAFLLLGLDIHAGWAGKGRRLYANFGLVGSARLLSGEACFSDEFVGCGAEFCR